MASIIRKNLFRAWVFLQYSRQCRDAYRGPFFKVICLRVGGRRAMGYVMGVPLFSCPRWQQSWVIKLKSNAFHVCLFYLPHGIDTSPLRFGCDLIKETLDDYHTEIVCNWDAQNWGWLKSLRLRMYKLIPKCFQNSNAFGEWPYGNFFGDCLNALGAFPNAYCEGFFWAHFIAN